MTDNEDIRERSGSVYSVAGLVAYLYTRMSYHLTPGEVEQMMSTMVYHGLSKFGDECNCKPHAEGFQFSNGWLAEYAKDIAQRLEGM